MFYEKLVAFTGSRVAFTALTLSVLGTGCIAFAQSPAATAPDVSSSAVTESSGKISTTSKLKGWMHRPSLMGWRNAGGKEDAGVTWTSDPKAMQTTENIGANEVVAETTSVSPSASESKKEDTETTVVGSSTSTSPSTTTSATTNTSTTASDAVHANSVKPEGAGAQEPKIESTKAEVKSEASNTDVAAKVEEATKTETPKTDAKELPADAPKEAVAQQTEESKTDAVKADAGKIEAKSENKAETTAENKVEAKAETKAETTAETKAETKAETNVEAKAETKPESKSETVKPEGAQAPSKELAMIGGEVHTEATDGPVMIDNDEAVETQQTIEYHDLPTDEGGTKVKAGATFPVVISSQITSKSANTGDPFEARLKYDLKIKDRLIAEKGSTVIGHVNYVLKARSVMHSLISPERWYRNSGCLGIAFDEIVNTKGEHIPLVATPARQARIIKNKAEGRELGVNHNGQVTGPWSQQLRYKAVRIGLNAAMAPAGVFSFGAMPVALGCIGAANPSFAFMKPVGQNVRHRRIKGFVWGALSGVPGSWVVEDTIVKGQEAVIKPGDEFLAEFKEEFTGEPETEASLIPGASTKVKGQVVPVKKGKK